MRSHARGRATLGRPVSRPIVATFPSPRRRKCHRAYLDNIQGLDDAGGAHAGQAAVQERLDGFPGCVILERHGVGSVVRAETYCATISRGVLFLSQRARVSPEPAAERGKSRLCAT